MDMHQPQLKGKKEKQHFGGVKWKPNHETTRSQVKKYPNKPRQGRVSFAPGTVLRNVIGAIGCMPKDCRCRYHVTFVDEGHRAEQKVTFMSHSASRKAFFTALGSFCFLFFFFSFFKFCVFLLVGSSCCFFFFPQFFPFCSFFLAVGGWKKPCIRHSRAVSAARDFGFREGSVLGACWGKAARAVRP